MESLPYVKLNYAGIFIGGTFSYLLYGIACSQAAFYFRTYTNDIRRLKIFVCFAVLLETAQSSILVPTLWHYLIVRGLDRSSFLNFMMCQDWSAIMFGCLIEATCLLVECFFLIRMWQFSPSKKFVVLALMLALVGWALSGVYIVTLWRVRCYSEMVAAIRLVYISFGLRVASDGIMVGTMCYYLYTKSPITRHIRTNTRQLVRALIIWTMASGIFMWFTSVVFVVTSLTVQHSQLALGIFLIRGRIYSNTMLALLNYRETHRKMANKTVVGTLDIPTINLDSVRPRTTLDSQSRQTESIPLETISTSVGATTSTSSTYGFLRIPQLGDRRENVLETFNGATTSTSSSEEMEKSAPVHYHPKDLDNLFDARL
ncbi:hypothetical protein BDQ17DRAFT_1407695 [Cyathus striatus]|nr:hypothetical protein BDQ17DRAFT_1407695 [Cyathus striatus]